MKKDPEFSPRACKDERSTGYLSGMLLSTCIVENISFAIVFNMEL